MVLEATLPSAGISRAERPPRPVTTETPAVRITLIGIVMAFLGFSCCCH